jgi:hypothetical protein
MKGPRFKIIGRYAHHGPRDEITGYSSALLATASTPGWAGVVASRIYEEHGFAFGDPGETVEIVDTRPEPVEEARFGDWRDHFAEEPASYDADGFGLDAAGDPILPF